MTRLDNIFNIADEKNFSWWEDMSSKEEEDVKDSQPEIVDNGNEGKVVDPKTHDEKGVKDPKPDAVDKGDGKEDITSTKEGVKDPQPDNGDDSDFIAIDEGFHQSNYHSSIDDYTEYDWLI